MRSLTPLNVVAPRLGHVEVPVRGPFFIPPDILRYDGEAMSRERSVWRARRVLVRQRRGERGGGGEAHLLSVQKVTPDAKVLLVHVVQRQRLPRVLDVHEIPVLVQEQCRHLQTRRWGPARVVERGAAEVIAALNYETTIQQKL